MSKSCCVNLQDVNDKLDVLSASLSELREAAAPAADQLTLVLGRHRANQGNSIAPRSSFCYMAVSQNQWYHFGVGAPPVLVYFSGDWDVHWGYGLLTHGHVYIYIFPLVPVERSECLSFCPRPIQLKRLKTRETHELRADTLTRASAFHSPQSFVGGNKTRMSN